MDVKELIKLDSHKVRGNANLMAIYIDAYEKQFGRKPNCAGCTFANDWARFIVAVRDGNSPVSTNNSKTMENTFKLKKIQGKILAYKSGGKTFRLYDNNLNEAFVIGFLTNGTEEQLAERKAMFSLLPKELREEKVNKPEANAEKEAAQDKEVDSDAKEQPKEKKTRKRKSE